MNDAWIWLGLLAVAFGRAVWAIPLACVLYPWIDERFIIGFPLAWVVRCLDRREPFIDARASVALWLLPYVGLRFWLNRNPAGDHVTADFLRTVLSINIGLAQFVPLGWWMGLRTGWVLVACAVWLAPAGRRVPAAGVLLATLVVSWLLASDLSRSAAIALPLVLLGCFALAQKFSLHTPGALLVLGLTSLLVPAAHVSYTKIDLI